VTEKEKRGLELRSKAAISAGCAFAYGRFCLAVLCAVLLAETHLSLGHINLFTEKEPGRSRTLSLHEEQLADARFRTLLQGALHPYMCWAQTSDSKTALKSLTTKILLGSS